MLENDKHNQYVGEKIIYTILNPCVYLFGCCNIDDGTPVPPAIEVKRWNSKQSVKVGRGNPGILAMKRLSVNIINECINIAML